MLPRREHRSPQRTGLATAAAASHQTEGRTPPQSADVIHAIKCIDDVIEKEARGGIRSIVFGKRIVNLAQAFYVG